MKNIPKEIFLIMDDSDSSDFQDYGIHDGIKWRPDRINKTDLSYKLSEEWTKEIPTEEGYYCIRDSKCKSSQVVKFEKNFAETNILWIMGNNVPVDVNSIKYSIEFKKVDME